MSDPQDRSVSEPEFEHILRAAMHVEVSTGSLARGILSYAEEREAAVLPILSWRRALGGAAAALCLGAAVGGLLLFHAEMSRVDVLIDMALGNVQAARFL